MTLVKHFSAPAGATPAEIERLISEMFPNGKPAEGIMIVFDPPASDRHSRFLDLGKSELIFTKEKGKKWWKFWA